MQKAAAAVREHAQTRSRRVYTSHNQQRRSPAPFGPTFAFFKPGKMLKLEQNCAIEAMVATKACTVSDSERERACGCCVFLRPACEAESKDLHRDMEDVKIQT